MADYLAAFWKLFAHDRRLRFHSVFLGQDASDSHVLKHMREVLPVREVSPRRANAMAWDLAVCADHCFRDARERVPTVYIGHGPKNKVVSGDTVGYAYGRLAFDDRGRVAYRKIFAEQESDRQAAIRANRAFERAVVVVGSLESDSLLEQGKRRDEFRAKLGFAAADTVVLVLSTWGPYCLWHTMGDAVLDEAEKLQAAFKFVLSAHPNEFRPQPNGERVWGEHLRLQRQRGFVVREPSEDWIPYMVASDIIVSDYTGLVEYAVLLQKPIVLTPVPDDRIWKDSITWRIREFAPILEDAGMLGQYLVRAKEDYPQEKLEELMHFMHPHPGEAAGRIRKEVYSLLNIPAPGHKT